MINTICWLWLASTLSAPKWLMWLLGISLGLDILVTLIKAAINDG